MLIHYNRNQNHFEVTVKASASKVWQTLWDDGSYMQWTSVFHAGSYAKSDWKQGSKIQFLGPGGNGMYSEIELLEPEKKMVFKHLSEIKDYQEQPIETSASWSGSKESYTLTESDGQTKITVSVDFPNEMEAYFKETFPKALAIVKELSEKNYITVMTSVHADIEKVWNYWIDPKHIVQWNHASDDWHTPKATNHVKVGAHFTYTMAAKDGSASFDFEGTYIDVKLHEKISYAIVGGRKVFILFAPIDGQIRIVETFEAENQNPLKMQKTGWQSILDNFKKHVESDD
ncbi:SRPBCC family protein [Flavobacterium sp.]|uniref:SRPBCC family protein n=1 Tax=Flavobacterium sp. TaxID=239 RepID=UPI00262673F5|nr:SRPBCC family protein [Flavobacterium sp.]